jgi:hypothetical protein
MSDTNSKLWELSKGVLELERHLVDSLDENNDLDDEARESLFQEWLALGENFNDKVLSVAAYIRHESALAEARKAEAKRLTDLAKTAENRAERLKQYLAHQMELTGRSKVEGVDGVVSIRKSPGSVVLKVEEDKLPPEYQRVKVTADKTALKLALKSGQATEWATLETRMILSIK